MLYTHQDLVSIIMPSYNSEKYISSSIQSIIMQTFQNWELIITDDCSLDSTLTIIKKFMSIDNRIKMHVLVNNSGSGVARNNSIKFAKGRYIAFCDSDDMWVSNKLQFQLDFLKSNDLSFTYSSYSIINGDNVRVGEFIVPKKISFNSLLKSCDIGCLTAIYDSKKIGKIFMPETRLRQDYGLWLKIFSKIDYTEGQLETLALYRVHENSISKNKIKAAIGHWTTMSKFSNKSNIINIFYFFIYVFKGFKKLR